VTAGYLGEQRSRKRAPLSITKPPLFENLSTASEGLIYRCWVVDPQWDLCKGGVVGIGLFGGARGR